MIDDNFKEVIIQYNIISNRYIRYCNEKSKDKIKDSMIDIIDEYLINQIYSLEKLNEAIDVTRNTITENKEVYNKLNYVAIKKIKSIGKLNEYETKLSKINKSNNEYKYHTYENKIKKVKEKIKKYKTIMNNRKYYIENAIYEVDKYETLDSVFRVETNINKYIEMPNNNKVSNYINQLRELRTKLQKIICDIKEEYD